MKSTATSTAKVEVVSIQKHKPRRWTVTLRISHEGTETGLITLEPGDEVSINIRSSVESS